MSQTPELDVAYARGHFPGLDDWAFFENAGGSLVPRAVIDRVNAHMTETRVQPGAAFPASARAAEHHAKAQALMAEMINAAPEEVIIGGSTTINMYVLSQALRPWFAPGDEVVVTNLDHEANSGAWRRLAEVGAVVKEWRIDPGTCELEIDELDKLLTERTRLVCFTHCSNVTGSIHDVRAIVERVHAAGALACVDAVAYAPHRRLDVKATDVDFYACSLYKLYGPHLALLYGKREHLLRARSQNHYFFGADDIPSKLALGGYNHELTAGPPGIIDYLDAIHGHHFPGSNAGLHERLGETFALFAAHEQTLATRFADFLESKPNLRIIGRATGDHTRRAPTFSFVVEGRDSEDFPKRALAHKVAFRAGDFYAARLIDALGLRPQNGVVRVSMVHYNTMAEVDRVIRTLDESI
ncbi:MAG: cysteine desulfurase-like protein [Alphaproteobacteria bacterium]